MIMADLFKWVFLVLGLLITLVSYWVLFEALYSGVVERARDRYANRPVRTILIGAAVCVPVTLIGTLFVNAPNAVGKFIGLVLLMLLFAMGLLGSSGLCRLVGERLPSPVDAAQPWRRVFRGGTVLSIAFVLPMVGWFLVLPLTLVSGVGAAVTSLRAPKAKSEAPAAPSDAQAAGA